MFLNLVTICRIPLQGSRWADVRQKKRRLRGWRTAPRPGLERANATFLYRHPKNQRMARHLADKTGCLAARQKRCEGLAALLWI